MTEIPKAISPDQYDKLMRKLWELEEKYKYDHKATLDAVSLDMLFDQQRDIQKRLAAIEAALLLPRSEHQRLGQPNIPEHTPKNDDSHPKVNGTQGHS